MLAIKAENIGKQYRLGQIGTGTISHDLNRWWAGIRGKEDPYSKIGAINDRTTKVKPDYVWALKNIDFEIRKGDAVGIIGRNGAGKSTLLKILSRTTLPSKGSVKMKGRVASLLEVGTGFHPEMTGRENIFQNGAILGMTRHEIKRKFDEIVDFSGCDAYIDTPVKRYSSGMYVRLAFAVAAHLESEILIVDEVLAVGDAEFQKKCLGKMNSVAKGEGRTVLFVSHNMAAISNNCSSCIYLENGTLKEFDDVQKVLDRYLNEKTSLSGSVTSEDIIFDQQNKYFTIDSIKIINNNVVTSEVLSGKETSIVMEYSVLADGLCVSPSFHLLDSMGGCIFASGNSPEASTNIDLFHKKKLSKGRYKVEMVIPSHFLNDTSYSISAFLVPDSVFDMTIAREAISFHVIDSGEMRGDFTGIWIGSIRPKMFWNTEKIE